MTEIAPALTPLLIRPFPFAALSGLSFTRMRFSVWRDGKKVADHTGDVLFTHLGLSGPGILDASREIRPGDVVRLSFVGAMRREEFAADLAKRAAENPRLAGGHDPGEVPDPGAAEPETAAPLRNPGRPEVRPLLCRDACTRWSRTARSSRWLSQRWGILRLRW